LQKFGGRFCGEKLTRRAAEAALLVCQFVKNLRAESLRCSRLGFGGFFLAVFGRRGGFQRTEKAVCGGGYFVNRNKERGFVGLRRFVKTGDLPYELEGRSLDFPGGHWRVKVKKSLDVSAHLLILMDWFAARFREAQKLPAR